MARTNFDDMLTLDFEELKYQLGVDLNVYMEDVEIYFFYDQDRHNGNQRDFELNTEDTYIEGVAEWYGNNALRISFEFQDKSMNHKKTFYSYEQLLDYLNSII